MTQSNGAGVEWDDTTTPRTDNPASFLIVPRHARRTFGTAVIGFLRTTRASLFTRMYLGGAK